MTGTNESAEAKYKRQVKEALQRFMADQTSVKLPFAVKGNYPDEQQMFRYIVHETVEEFESLVSVTDETWSFLFDFDGTIIDSFADLEHCTNDTLRELGLSALPLPTIRGMIGYGLEHLLRSALDEAEGGGVSTEKAVAVFRPIYAGCGWTRTTMFDGMREVLEDLSAHRRALVSNKGAMG